MMIIHLIKRLVGSGIYSLTDQLLAKVSVPVVLDLIVRTPWNSPSYQRPPENNQVEKTQNWSFESKEHKTSFYIYTNINIDENPSTLENPKPTNLAVYL